MIKHIFAISILSVILSLNNLVAQTNIYTDSLAKNYDRHTILLQNWYFEKGDVKVPYGFLKNNLRREMNRFMMSGHEYKKYQNKRLISASCSVIGVGLMLASIKDRRVNWTQYSIGTGVALLAIPFTNQSNNHYNRAIWLYNREAILSERGR